MPDPVRRVDAGATCEMQYETFTTRLEPETRLQLGCSWTAVPTLMA